MEEFQVRTSMHVSEAWKSNGVSAGLAGERRKLRSWHEAIDDLRIREEKRRVVVSVAPHGHGSAVGGRVVAPLSLYCHTPILHGYTIPSRASAQPTRKTRTPFSPRPSWSYRQPLAAESIFSLSVCPWTWTRSRPRKPTVVRCDEPCPCWLLTGRGRGWMFRFRLLVAAGATKLCWLFPQEMCRGF
jgi:hypothetical protein